MSDLFTSLADAVTSGDVAEVARLTTQGLAGGAAPGDVLNKGLMPGMDVVGQLFRDGELFIPEVLMSARAMGASLDILKPLLTGTDAKGTGTVVIGTVEGDIHNIGKNLVAMLLEGAGFNVIDLGIDVKPETFVRATLDHKPDIVAMSALLTTTMPKMAATVEALREAGIRDQVKIMAGGAPVSADFVHGIGADEYASDGPTAVAKARALVGR